MSALSILDLRLVWLNYSREELVVYRLVFRRRFDGELRDVFAA